MSVTCKVLSKAAKRPTPKDESSSQSLPKWVEWADEGSSVGFLLMCLFVHLLYGVDGFHWSHKCCLTVGAALAISTILNGSSRYEQTNEWIRVLEFQELTCVVFNCVSGISLRKS